MKKLSLLLILCILPINAFAYREAPSTCYPETSIPSGYCCIQYTENGSIVDRLWNCDNMILTESQKATCKKEQHQCIDYCYLYDLDNDTCYGYQCAKEEVVANPIDATDCTIPNAETCEYKTLCNVCDKTLCHREDEEVSTCIDGYYNTEDWKQCLKCPGNGMVDYDTGNVGIAQCYIPRNPPLTGSDETGTWQYVNDKCYYRE